jgi:hypothetical protein
MLGKSATTSAQKTLIHASAQNCLHQCPNNQLWYCGSYMTELCLSQLVNLSYKPPVLLLLHNFFQTHGSRNRIEYDLVDEVKPTSPTVKGRGTARTKNVLLFTPSHGQHTRTGTHTPTVTYIHVHTHFNCCRILCFWQFASTQVHDHRHGLKKIPG